MSMEETAGKRFRIAFSFAGEKRGFVAEVAAIVAKRFGPEAILYDKYHEAEFARSDLGIYLPELYHKRCDLVVAVFCAEYGKKEWTGLEWTAIHDLLKKTPRLGSLFRGGKKRTIHVLQNRTNLLIANRKIKPLTKNRSCLGTKFTSLHPGP